MADAELHIIVKKAGDPEYLGALLNAAISMKEQERPTKTVVPVGYHCTECYFDDGGHALTCSMNSFGRPVQEGSTNGGPTPDSAAAPATTGVHEGNSPPAS